MAGTRSQFRTGVRSAWRTVRPTSSAKRSTASAAQARFLQPDSKADVAPAS